MKEAGLVIGKGNVPIYRHIPEGRSSGYLPDSRTLWEVLWENRDTVLGFAHSHPGFGEPSPSYEDVTTFLPVDRGLGRDLCWWIATGDSLALFLRSGKGYVSIPLSTDPVSSIRNPPVVDPVWANPPWLEELRSLSNYEMR